MIFNRALKAAHFTVNDAWVMFRVNRTPIRTGEGECDCLALIDAHSGYLFTITLLRLPDPGFNKAQARSVLSELAAKANARAKPLFISDEWDLPNLQSEAARQEMDVQRVPDALLRPLIADARDSFAHRFSPRAH